MQETHKWFLSKKQISQFFKQIRNGCSISQVKKWVNLLKKIVQYFLKSVFSRFQGPLNQVK